MMVTTMEGDGGMKKLPIGVQTFRRIVEDGHVYVDKTKYVHDIINDNNCYFFSRPRRFGKSLLLDTIAEVFNGEKTLFDGLYISQTSYGFPKHPILRFDMSNISNESPEILRKGLSDDLLRYVERERLDIQFNTPAHMFKNLIEDICNKYGKKVVVLIDEYDKPILDRINSEKISEGNRDVLREFYGVLKSMEPYLRFTFVTGITKFTKTSIFSGLNNLNDITLDECYANICGILPKELDIYFDEHMNKLAELGKFGDRAAVMGKILRWYDGYSWNGRDRLINPFSLLNFLSKKRFSGYWYAGGTPTFLIDVIKNQPFGYLDLTDSEIDESSLDTTDIRSIDPVSLMFQAGYLTIEEIIETQPAVYKLRIPNLEVENALNFNIFSEFTQTGVGVAGIAYVKIKKALKTADLQTVTSILRSLFASIPYQLHMSYEAYYHSIFYALLSILGFDVNAETSVAGGRIDAVLELSDKVYVIEMKYANCQKDADETTKKAIFEKALIEGMNQINERGYTDKYIGGGKVIYKTVFAFLGRSDIEMMVEKIE